MRAIDQTIIVQAGNGATVIFGPIVNIDGRPLDLRSARADWWVGRSVGVSGADVLLTKSTDDALSIIVTSIDPDLGTFYAVSVALTPADTINLAPNIRPNLAYFYQLRLELATGEVSTAAHGVFELVPTIIR